MRTYLVVMDETEEAKQALRFASLRAHKTGGSVHILALVPQQTFNAFGGVQATIEQEARERAEVMANSAAGNIFGEMGKMPTIAVRPRPGPMSSANISRNTAISPHWCWRPAQEGGSGPLVTHFAGHAGQLPCPLYLVPGGLSRDEIDALA